MDFIETLLKEKEILLKRLEDIDATLKELYKNDPLEIEDSKEGDEESTIKNPIYDIYDALDTKKGFPRTGRRDQKVLWLFENVFTTGQQFTSIQDTFTKYNGLKFNKEVRIESAIKNLKSNGKLTVVKYNNSNKLSFWGLTDWIDDNGFKDEHKPKDEFLPLKIESVEVNR
jgi:hypothetical protein